MAARMPGVGRVTVSLRRSMKLSAMASDANASFGDDCGKVLRSGATSKRRADFSSAQATVAGRSKARINPERMVRGLLGGVSVSWRLLRVARHSVAVLVFRFGVRR